MNFKAPHWLILAVSFVLGALPALMTILPPASVPYVLAAHSMLVTFGAVLGITSPSVRDPVLPTVAPVGGAS